MCLEFVLVASKIMAEDPIDRIIMPVSRMMDYMSIGFLKNSFKKYVA